MGSTGQRKAEKKTHVKNTAHQMMRTGEDGLPNYSRDVEFYIEDMAVVHILEFSDALASTEVPDANAHVI